MKKTWDMEGCDPIADIRAAMERIKDTGYIPARCFYCGGILPDHLEECRIARALKAAFKKLREVEK